MANRPTSKRELLAKALHASRLHRLPLPVSKPRLTVFAWHRLYREKPSEHLDHTVFDMQADEFYDTIKGLKELGPCLDEEQLLAIIAGVEPMPPRAFAITFDDGYVDNFTIARPILKSLGVPAFFFIASSLTSNRRLGWWDEVAYIIRNSSKSVIKILGQEWRVTKDNQHKVIKSIQNLCKVKPETATRNLLPTLAQQAEVARPTTPIADRELMTWSQIKKLHSEGFTIGSHTCTHRVLATLPAATQLQELKQSKETIERQLGAAVRCFAYPVGGKQHFTAETRSLVAAAGYQAAFSYSTGVNVGDCETFAIKRTPAAMTTAENIGKVAFPAIF